jgi:hypothetical protein
LVPAAQAAVENFFARLFADPVAVAVAGRAHASGAARLIVGTATYAAVAVVIADIATDAKVTVGASAAATLIGSAAADQARRATDVARGADTAEVVAEAHIIAAAARANAAEVAAIAGAKAQIRDRAPDGDAAVEDAAIGDTEHPKVAGQDMIAIAARAANRQCENESASPSRAHAPPRS